MMTGRGNIQDIGAIQGYIILHIYTVSTSRILQLSTSLFLKPPYEVLYLLLS
jgi:hypothetical protein